MNLSKQIWIFIAIGVLLILIIGFSLVDKQENNLLEEEQTTGVLEDTKTTPRSTSKGESRSNQGIPKSDELTVTYTSSGFSPRTLEVNAGDSVNFVNNSGGTMWVTSESHPTLPNQNYPEFNQKRSVGSRQSWSFQFTRTGIWGYINLNNNKHLGAIIVIPQNQQ